MKTLNDTLNDYIAYKRFFCMEGDTGVRKLNILLADMGYHGGYVEYGSPVEAFLADNPGAIEALLNWAADQNVNEWSDNLKSTLPEG